MIDDNQTPSNEQTGTGTAEGETTAQETSPVTPDDSPVTSEPLSPSSEEAQIESAKPVNEEETSTDDNADHPYDTAEKSSEIATEEQSDVVEDKHESTPHSDETADSTGSLEGTPEASEFQPHTDPEPVPDQPVAQASTPQSPQPPSEPEHRETSAEAKQTFEEAMASMDEADASDAGPGLAKGARVKARVIQVDKDQVFVDLGTKAEGIVPLSELSEVPISSTEGHVEIGQEFDVIVLQSRNTEGNPVVSKRRADFEQTWAKIVERYESKEVFEATVFERVKGGLLVDLGVRGFVPTTHVATGHARNLDKFLGEVLPFKIIEIDHARKKVVLSHKMAMEESNKARKEEVFGRIKVGDVVEGVVQRLTDYGAFVDIGGVDGLLHVSEISWVRLEHPREELKEGETIQVEVLKVDEDGGKISLGRRGILPDPWNAVAANYTSGEKIKVNVRRFVPKGVFVRLPEGVEAFMPVSEIANPKPNSPEDVLNVGDEIEPFIQKLDPERRQMVLSLLGPRRANFEEGPGFQMRRPKRSGKPGGGGGGGNTPGQNIGATIGERLGALKGMLGNDSGGGEKPADSGEAKAPAQKKQKPAPEKSEAPKADEARADEVKAEEVKVEQAPTAEAATEPVKEAQQTASPESGQEAATETTSEAETSKEAGSEE